MAVVPLGRAGADLREFSEVTQTIVEGSVILRTDTVNLRWTFGFYDKWKP